MGELNREQNILIQIARNYLEGGKQATFEKFDFLDIDWSILYDLMIEQKMFPLVYNILCDSIPLSYRESYQETSDSMKNMNYLIFEEIRTLSQREDVEEMLFIKGAILSQLLYDDPFIRTSGDIDTLIREASLEQIDKLLKDEGYFQACGKDGVYASDYDNLEILPYPILKDYRHHEYFEYYKQSGTDYVILELQRYIHNTITSEHIDRFLDSSRLLMVNGVKVRTLDTDHTLLYLIESLHTDANWYYRGPKLNKYLELALFIRKYEKTIDWERVLHKSDEFQMTDIVHDIFNDLNELFHSLISQSRVDQYKYSKRNKSLSLIWETHLVERLFQSDEDRMKEIYKNLKRICYSTESLNHAVKLDNYNEQDLNYSQSDHYLYVPNDKYDYVLTYLPTVDSTNLTFAFYLPIELVQSSYDWEVIFNTIDPCIESSILDWHTFSFAKQEGEIQINVSGCGSVERVGDSEIRIQIPLSEFNSSSIELALAYKIILRERIYGNIYHTLNSDGYMDNRFWLSPSLIQVSVR
ncbi:nucleotidyltransferase family protein [Paenibacillus antarcticus]|uniref:Nucleotidyltransferase n=2 Tax=Paenibacillus antarcticus TaxID=253703 RepID=A0A168QNB8_9BACL|nr:nucleotidyltransferase family protein [Paenibacillus antarcticus]OAB47989.1 hypothetical protein PBAT_03690 [Paenibacillus antarcticus]